MTKLSLLLIIGLFIVSCGGNGGSTKKGDTTTSEYTGQEISIVGENLTTPEATLKKIEESSDFSKVTLPWLTGEWASFAVPGLGVQDRYLSLNSDGTYAYKDISLSKHTKTKSAHNGSYTVYAHSSSKWYMLLLTAKSNNVVTSYILEKADNDSFRIINKYKYPAFGSNFLYTRLSSKTPAVYPGMSFLGTYQYTDHTDIISGSNKNVYTYQFNSDYTIVKRHYYDVDYNDFELRLETLGTWKINQKTFQLEMTFNGEVEKYTIVVEFNPEGPYLALMKDGEDDNVHWIKTGDIKVVSDEDQFVGEYREHDGQSNITIKKNGNDYLVDIYYTFLQVNDLEAKLNTDGDLEMHPPNKYEDDTLLVFRAGYNRLIVKKDMANSISQMEYIEKISKHILPKKTNEIYGGWNSRNYSTKDHVYFQHYMRDGTFFKAGSGGSVGYGTYTFDGSKLTTTKTCKEPFTSDTSLSGRLLDNTLTYYPIVGTQSFGKDGSQAESILFKHQQHVYQTKNGAKLKPHPKLKSAYLFTKLTQFNDTYNYFKLKPDGTGTFFAGSSLYYEDDFSGGWNQETNSHLFNIKYMVVLDGEKEYLIYYLSGISVNYRGYDSKTTVLNYTETIKDARTVELFHGRTALCYKIGDQSRSGGIILPMNTEK